MGRLATLLLIVLTWAGTGWAGDEHYGYDELGRLIRVVDEQGRVTRYTHDPVGNLLGVSVDTTEPPSDPPTLEIDDLRCGAAIDLTLAGSDLQGTRLSTSDPALIITGLRYTDAGMTFTLTVNCVEALGSQAITIELPTGEIIHQTVDILPDRPSVFVTPALIAIPPDGSERAFLLRLSHRDTIDHHFSLVATDPAVAILATAELTITAGNTEALGYLRGMATGQTILTIHGSELGDRAVPIFVTTDFAGINTSHAPYLGVQVGTEGASMARPIDLSANIIGVVRGSAITAVTPGSLSRGDSNGALTITGVRLDGIDGISIYPADGLTLGELSISPGGALHLPVAVAEDAPVGARRILLHSADARRIDTIPPGADRFNVVELPPLISSIDPIVAVIGETFTLTLRGERLGGAYAIESEPPEGIVIDQTPSVSSGGRLLTARISIPPNAAPGPRTLRVITPGGASDPTPSPVNTLQVVFETGGEVRQLPGTVVGVLKGENAGTEIRVGSALAIPVSVAKGPVLIGIEPRVGAIGTELTLTIAGRALQAVDTVTILPDDGLQLSTPVVSPDGTEVTVGLSIAPNAPRMGREVRLMASGKPVPASMPGADRFLVAAPPPVIDSIDPLVLIRGAGLSVMRIRGSNLWDGRPSIIPPDGSMIGGVSVSSDGHELEFQVATTASAALGPRVVLITTPGGNSGSEAGGANTVHVITDSGSTVFPNLGAAPLGVWRGSPFGRLEHPASLSAPILGLQKGDSVSSDQSNPMINGAPLGVARGPIARGLVPDNGLPGNRVTLAVNGDGLAAVSAVSLFPAQGSSISGPPQASPDGRTLWFEVDLAADATPGPRRVELTGQSGSIPFAHPALGQFHVGPADVAIHSLQPIIAGRGQTLTLLIRGVNLFGAESVTAIPAEGLVIGNGPQVNADGTELTVAIAVSGEAPTGPRVIQVHFAGAVTSDQADPANTLTVYESVPN